ncbi:MAG: acetyltransferase [Pirellula sp.]|jgi:UDP-perosamine 4-acetyltransferase|nr:acetyltransferase [Pirellula sp.]
MSSPVIIIGNGGHASVVCSALRASGRKVLAATDVVSGRQGRMPSDIRVISDEQLLDEYRSEDVELALGVGSIWPNTSTSPWQRITNRFESCGFRFVTIIHPFAWVSPDSKIGKGCQLHAGAIVQPGVTLGEFTVLNTRASIDHDCNIGAYCHLSPGATLSGDVTLGDGCHLGTGCSVVQGIELGQGCFVAAGATVVTSHPDHQYLKGTPARSFSPSIQRT